MCEKRVKNIAVGLIPIPCDILSIFSHSAGLQSGTNVTANGVGIGTVKSVVIDPKTAQVVVTFSIKKDFTFSKNTVAEIYSSLVGNTSLQLLPAMDGAALAQAGDTLTSHIQTSLMDAIGANIEPTIGNLNKALTAADSLLIHSIPRHNRISKRAWPT